MSSGPLIERQKCRTRKAARLRSGSTLIELLVVIAIIARPVSPWSRSLFNSLAQIIVQSTRAAGEIKLTVSADGLMPATAMLTTQPCLPRPCLP